MGIDAIKPITAAIQRVTQPVSSPATQPLSLPNSQPIPLPNMQPGSNQTTGSVLPNKGSGLETLKDIYGEKKLKQIGVIPCATCASRVYQDASNDPGVSFKSPTHVSPEQSHSAVMSHENEHVQREQQKADQEDREVVSQSVTLSRSICPECGKSFISGGVTKTVTQSKQGYNQPTKEELKGLYVDQKT